MPKAKVIATTEEIPARSAKINLDSQGGRAVLAAWQGMVHLFDAEVDHWAITDTGVEAEGFSVSGLYDPETIVRDISNRERRLDLLSTYPTLMGETPPPFTSAAEITAFTIQFYKGSVDENSARTPAYVKQATAAFKSRNALAKKRGPKTKTIRLDNLDSLDESTLANITDADLAKLQAVIENVYNHRNAATPEMVVASV